ncbi:MAG: phosphotransferase [Alphaproteobacteria bacterium]|nr:phosphotransferase [Alphaproteobacteria bacterium]MBV8411263.1 phosphotransferase [Alphaproteobacteria bacterium]
MPTSERKRLRAAFRNECGWADAHETWLAGDASFRTYYRVARLGRVARLRRVARLGHTAIIMDAPPATEDVRPFVRIARHLRALGLSAPEVLAADEANGFLLLEDLGDDTFSRMLDAGVAEGLLYERATDVLIALQAAGSRALLPGLNVYLGEALAEAAMLLPEWYAPAALQRPVDEAECSDYRAAWRACVAALPVLPTTLMLRDYHKDNLLWLPDRPGVKACGLLDFQDAQEGHCAYDLVSLIEDARRDVSPAVHDACVARYIAETGVDEDDFMAGFAVMAAQRHGRILGLFVRLARRDGKPEYLKHLPRVRHQFERALRHDALAPLRTWVDRVLPATRPPIGAA